MDNEKWLHMGTSEGKIKRHDHPHQKLDLRGRRFKVVQLVAAALLFGFLFSLNFDHARFFARSWIEDAVSRAEDEMVCDFSEVCLRPYAACISYDSPETPFPVPFLILHQC